MESESCKRMGIYIDVDNVEKGSSDYRSEGMVIDYAELVNQISKGYELVVLNGYDCEVNNTNGFDVRAFLEGMGITPVLSKPQTKHDLNGQKVLVQKEVDTGICTHVTRDIYKGKVDVAVIVSGDRDMYPPVQCAEEDGLDVRVYALEVTLKDGYAEILGDRLTYIDDLPVFVMTSDATAQPENNISSSVIKGVTVDE